jgi:hypothetical protein
MIRIIEGFAVDWGDRWRLPHGLWCGPTPACPVNWRCRRAGRRGCAGCWSRCGSELGQTPRRRHAEGWRADAADGLPPIERAVSAKHASAARLSYGRAPACARARVMGS